MTRLVLLALSAAFASGCDSGTSKTAPTGGTTTETKDVHVNTPRVNVDVNNKGDGKGVDVDVHRKP